MHNQMQARQAAYAKRDKQSKLRETELAGKLAVAQARLCEAEIEAARTSEEQLANVLAENQAVSEAHNAGSAQIDVIRAVDLVAPSKVPVTLQKAVCLGTRLVLYQVLGLATLGTMHRSHVQVYTLPAF